MILVVSLQKTIVLFVINDWCWRTTYIRNSTCKKMNIQILINTMLKILTNSLSMQLCIVIMYLVDWGVDTVSIGLAMGAGSLLRYYDEKIF